MTTRNSQPKIVVLDGATMNPGDLSWSPLEAVGECTIYDRTLPEQTVARSRGADIVLTNKVVLTREVLESLDSLRYVGLTSTGCNSVDLEAASERGIVVSNVPDYCTRAVAQMVFAHLLNLTQRVADHATAVSRGEWSRSLDFCFWNFPLVELESKTMGIIGFGKIGRAVAALAKAFGMQVIANSRTKRDFSPAVRYVDLNTVFEESDVVSLHCPWTVETEKIVDAERLAQMKRSAFLINTSRGALVDEAALADALNRGEIAGAGLDVLSTEPPAESNPLQHAKNCYITPHIAWATQDARLRLMNAVVENIAAFLAGNPRHEVNKDILS